MRKGCYGSSGRKIRHLTFESAEAHRIQLENNSDDVHKVESYLCNHCYGWHVGRKGAPPEMRQMLRNTRTKDLWDEILVGKLIGAIKIAVGDKRLPPRREQ